MRLRSVALPGFAVTAGMALVAVAWPQHTAAMQAPASNLPAVYAQMKTLPDWSGAWEADAQPSALQTNVAVPLAPKYAAQLDTLRKSIKAGAQPPGNPKCQPAGMPLFMEHKGPLIQILYAPGRVLFEAGNLEGRIVYTDNSAVPDSDLDYFDGTSAAHWEKDTLVIKTTGIHPFVQLLPGIENGGGLMVDERIHLVAADKLQDDITLSGPAFTKPYSYTRTLTRHRNWDVSEYICLADNGTDYGVEPKPTPPELAASSTAKPPVRQVAQPAPDAQSLAGSTWDSIAGLPDWGNDKGMWAYDNRPSEIITGEVLPLTPPYLKRFDELHAISKQGGDVPSDNYHCRPRGPTQLMKGAAALFYFVFTPGQVTLIPDDSQMRRFYTDGRGHPAHVELSFMGHSIGHWEGDTLVTDTVGIRPDVQMMYGLNSGGQLDMQERFHRISTQKLQVDTVLTSPVSLAKPWSYTRTYTYKPDWKTMESYCAQNNVDVDPGTGMQTFQNVPPPQ